MDGTRSKLIDQSSSLPNHMDQIHSRNTSVGIRFWIQLFNIFPFNLDSFRPWYGCKCLVPTLRGKLATLTTPYALDASQNGNSDVAWVETMCHHSGPICSYSRSAHLNKKSEPQAKFHVQSLENVLASEEFSLLPSGSLPPFVHMEGTGKN